MDAKTDRNIQLPSLKYYVWNVLVTPYPPLHLRPRIEPNSVPSCSTKTQLCHHWCTWWKRLLGFEAVLVYIKIIGYMFLWPLIWNILPVTTPCVLISQYWNITRTIVIPRPNIISTVIFLIWSQTYFPMSHLHEVKTHRMWRMANLAPIQQFLVTEADAGRYRPVWPIPPSWR